MNIKKLLLLTLCLPIFTACFNTSARISEIENSLVQVEEKVDALLTYSNTTHDAITDIDVRMAALEQDAKKRGVPVRIRGVDLAAAKAELDRTNGYVSPPIIPHDPLANTTAQTTQTDQLTVGQSLLSDAQAPSTDPNVSPQTTHQTTGQTTGQTIGQTPPLQSEAQMLLAQNPTLAALQGLSTETSSLPEQDMSTSQNPSQTQDMGNGMVMAEGITLRLPDDDDSGFVYPEHTQNMGAVEEAQLTQTPQTLQSAELGPITGQNLQVPPPVSPYTSVNDIPEPINLTPKTTSTQPPQTVANTLSPNTVNTNPPVTSPPTTANTNLTGYDGAMTLYKTRKYAESEKAFDDFLKANPNSPLAPNAIYWKGETLYARALYPQAIFAFKEVQTRYPKHSKAPDSLLKTAMSYEKLGDIENANLHYLVLTEDFPNSNAAKRAK